MIPRDYQTAAADALWNYVHTHPDHNPLVVMPTGTGKSLTMALFIWGMMQRYPHLRMMNLVHVKELVVGNYRALKNIWPLAPAGIYSAGLKKKEVHGQVTFAGIDSVRAAVRRFGKIDFIIVDEAHRISDNDRSTYQKVFKAFREINPNLIIIGFTATDYRMGMGKLTDGELFDHVCFDLSDGPAFVWMLDQRYLLKPVPKNPGFSVDESRVKIKAGEFDEKSASQAFRDQDILERAVDTVIQCGEEQGREAWLTFTQSIDDCDLVAEMFRYKGYDVEAVHSKMGGDRDEILKAFSEGKLRGVVNKDILTTGFDEPRIDLIAMLRLTRSPGLWVQMLGRGTRPLWTPGYDLTTWEGRNSSILASAKQDCLVLDFAGNTKRLGPINYPQIPKRKKGAGGDPPVRECPECGAYNHISLKCCAECGYEFPVEQKLEARASSQDLVVNLNDLPPPIAKEYGVFKVDQMIYYEQAAKPGKWPTLRVDYICGVRRFSTWVCPEHPGYPSMKAKDWWKGHGHGPMPAKALEMAQYADYRVPYYIKVWLNTKYPEIVGYDFVGTAFELPPELGGPPLRLAEDTAVEAEKERIKELAREMFDDEIPF